MSPVALIDWRRNKRLKHDYTLIMQDSNKECVYESKVFFSLLFNSMVLIIILKGTDTPCFLDFFLDEMIEVVNEQW